MSPADRPAKPRRRSSREPPERLPWLRYDRMARAVTERLRVRPVPGQPFWVLAVRNPVHHTQYHVFLPDYPSGEAQFCSCVDFARKGIGTCKHVEAAIAWLETHPELPPPMHRSRGAATLWYAIDAAEKATDASPLPAPVRLRIPGRVLFDRGGRGASRTPKKRVAGTGSAEPAARSGA